MALITSAASGNFDDVATWVGGVVPGVGDEARAATGHTITINVDTTCDEISNAGTGIYTLADGVTLTANCTHKSTTVNRNLLQFTAASPAVGNIVGNCTGGTANDAVAVVNTSSGTLNITGNVTGSGARAYGANNTNIGTINIVGNITGGGGTVNPSAVNNNSTGSINVTGIVTGGTSITGHAIRNSSTGTISVVGNISADGGGGLFNASTGTIVNTGDITATNSNNGIISLSSSASITISGSLISSANGFLAVSAPKFLMNPAPLNAKTRYALNGTGTYVDMFTADNNLTQAVPADVRSGTVYADGNLTGTLAVPAAASVALGVPVDAGTGTAVLTPEEVANAVWGATTSGLTTAGSIGERLKNSATVATTGEQLAAALTAP